MLHAVFVDGVHGSVVDLQKLLDLLSSILVVHDFLSEGDHAQPQVFVPAVHQHGVLKETCQRGLRLREQGRVYLIVENHLQSDVDIVDLYTIDRFLGVSAVYGQVGQQLGGGVGGDGHHFVGELLQLGHACDAVADQLP